MSNMTKVGYFLVGFGIGLFSASVICRHEMDKPIGEIEEYIPLDEKDSDVSKDISKDSKDSSKNSSSDLQKDTAVEGERPSRSIRKRREASRSRDGIESGEEFGSNQNEILNFYSGNDRDFTRPIDANSMHRHSEEFKERQFEQQQKEAKRYSQMYKNRMLSKDYIDPVDSSESAYSTDSPDDDEVYDSESEDYSKFTLERIEPGFDIFLDENPQDFATLIFYEGDNTLCDDGEQIIPNAENVVGLATLNRLIEGGPGAENGVIFVRNLKTSINYEVVLDAGSYCETVLGIFQSRQNNGGGADVDSR